MFKGRTFMDVYGPVRFSVCLIDPAILIFYHFCLLPWFVHCLWVHIGCSWFQRILKVCILSKVSSDFKRSCVHAIPEVALYCIKCP